MPISWQLWYGQEIKTKVVGGVILFMRGNEEIELRYSGYWAKIKWTGPTIQSLAFNDSINSMVLLNAHFSISSFWLGHGQVLWMIGWWNYFKILLLKWVWMVYKSSTVICRSTNFKYDKFEFLNKSRKQISKRKPSCDRIKSRSRKTGKNCSKPFLKKNVLYTKVTWILFLEICVFEFQAIKFKWDLYKKRDEPVSSFFCQGRTWFIFPKSGLWRI